MKSAKFPRFKANPYIDTTEGEILPESPFETSEVEQEEPEEDPNAFPTRVGPLEPTVTFNPRTGGVMRR